MQVLLLRQNLMESEMALSVVLVGIGFNLYKAPIYATSTPRLNPLLPEPPIPSLRQTE